MYKSPSRPEYPQSTRSGKEMAFSIDPPLVKGELQLFISPFNKGGYREILKRETASLGIFSKLL